jgi:uncharacterized protein YggE
MQKKQKPTNMKQRFLLLIFIVLCTLEINAQTNERFILVRGIAEREIEPNKIELSVFISSTEDTKTEGEIKKKETQLISLLKSLSIDQSNISLDTYSAYKFYGINFSKTTKFNLSKAYKITISKVELLDTLIPKLFEIGINNVNIVTIDHTDIEKYKLELIDLALENAKTKAQRISDQMNVKISKTIFISEVQTDKKEQFEAPYLNDQFLVGYASGVQIRGYAGNQITLEKIKLRKLIDVKFEIE